MNRKLSAEIDSLLSAYERPVEIMEGLTHSLKETIRRIYFYSMSEYLSKGTDGYGRRKPFKNIVNEHVDGEVTATDPDFKHLQLKAEGSSYAMTLLLRKKLVEWAKETGFSSVLNDLNETYVRYGGVLAKKRIEDGKLVIESVQWKDLVVDQIDITSGAIIERHWLSPTELRRKKGVWENIEEAVELASKTRNGVQAQATTDRVEILEVEGEFPLDMLYEDADEDDYALMRFIIATDGKKKVFLDGFEVRESQYKYHKRNKNQASGRTLGVGIVETGFEAQISANEVAIAERLAFELGGKVIAVTNSPDIAGQPLTSIEDGTIFELEGDEYFKAVSLLPSNVPEYKNLTQEWEQNLRNNTGVQSTTDDPKSGTAFRTLALQTKRGSGKSDYRREGFDFLVKEIITDWVLPYLAKEINKGHLMEEQFTAQELKAIDEEFSIPQLIGEVNMETINSIVGGNIVSPIQPTSMLDRKTKELKKTNRRKLQLPKDSFKDMMKKVTVLFDDEFLARQEQQQVLFDMWSSMAPEDPNRQLVWNEMVELGGAMSPASFVPTGTAKAATTSSGSDNPITQDINNSLPKAQQ